MSLGPQHLRLLEEYATLEYLLLGDLRAAVEEPEDIASSRWLVAVVKALLDAMPQKPELTGTIVAIAVERENPSANGLARLCEEQREILVSLERIHRRLQEGIDKSESMSGLVQALSEWMDHITDHNHRTKVALAPLLETGEESRPA